MKFTTKKSISIRDSLYVYMIIYRSNTFNMEVIHQSGFLRQIHICNDILWFYTNIQANHLSEIIHKQLDVLEIVINNKINCISNVQLISSLC